MNPGMESVDSMPGHPLIGGTLKLRQLNSAVCYYILNLQGDIVRLVNTVGPHRWQLYYNTWGKTFSGCYQ